MITTNTLYDFILESNATAHNIDVKILNDLFTFKQNHMPEESILDAIFEYCYRNKLDPVELAQELAEIPTFVNIVERDCAKFKYLVLDTSSEIDNSWE